jgi:hypothetical protein
MVTSIKESRMSQIAIRTAGFLLLAGAVLFSISIIMISTKPVMNRSFGSTESLLLFLAGLALLIALPALYFKQSATSGLPGLIGYITLQAGMVFIISIAAPRLFYPSFNAPLGESPVAFVLGICLVIGLLATGIGVLQAGVYPRQAGILILAATAGFFFVFFIAEFLPPITGQIGSAVFAILLGAAFAWIGVAMLIQ